MSFFSKVIFEKKLVLPAVRYTFFIKKVSKKLSIISVAALAILCHLTALNYNANNIKNIIMNITKDFNLSEFTASQKASQMGIMNIPTENEIESIHLLVTNLLQPLRDKIQEPITISSGYRSFVLNKAVGGVSTSQHLKGEAADCVCSSPKLMLSALKASRLVFDQAILYPTFLHLSLKKDGNRNQIIIK